MEREEHLAWCKERALEYLDRGALADAVASMGSDLSKHAETAAVNGYIMALGMRYVIDHNTAGVRQWIEGFR
jgi:hypothetical protein